MSATNFTAGPWEGMGSDGTWFQDHDWSADCDSASRSMFVPIHANGKVVALVVREDWDDAQMEADAALIAAAPELLEALKYTASTLQSVARDGAAHDRDTIRMNDGGDCKTIAQILDMADAALGKAKGAAA